ncbi:MAG: TatD family hydrolase [Bacillota bacterium]
MQLPESDSFINIHTHRSSSSEDEYALLNVFAQEISNYKFNYDFAYSAGLHPWHLQTESRIESLIYEVKQASRYDIVIAIGETGLDRAIKTPFEVQMKAFLPQILIAEESNKPVILHCVRAYSDMIGIRKKYRLSVPWIFHGFTGNLQIASQLIEMGCYLGFGKFLLNTKSKVPDLFSLLPDDWIFLEIDDSQYNIQQIYQQACLIKGYQTNKLKEIILKNFNRCFIDGRNK